MKPETVHHVSINVRDAEVAREFYVDVLGLDELDTRPDFPFPGYWLKTGAVELHLIEIPDFDPPQGQHFALQVSDLDGVLEELRSRGVPLDGEYMGMPGGKAIEIPGVGRQAFIFDPTGNMVELNEPRG